MANPHCKGNLRSILSALTSWSSYKLYVQSAENVSARRVASSRYLLSLNVALAALYGFQSASFGQSFWLYWFPCRDSRLLLWYLIIKSHANLNRVKFDVIHEFEQHLPAACTTMSGTWQRRDEERPTEQ